ncbi:class I SAM-dependent methyltransferase [Pollutimonas thiosulfatoxidans]|uniref:SAM-dependent methyltransferase n=1 Tax=Pollutimonas thiosulfatoxidans TaxID=2028345 RepID=A0A410GEG3_9BURK|nr:class I SAM-dependent methyltransferase [Pollutimonas thiosulfatoxidans]QAA94684.1 SAM-dependent methyltransferase [Pollutimonas thiosulfatoxidans]
MSDHLDTYIGAYKDTFAYSFDNNLLLNWYPKRIIDRVVPEAHVLELGVGHGFTTLRFAQHFARTVVVDGSAAVIEKFRQEHPTCRATIVESYFEDFNTDERFDVIVMGFILEHVNYPALILERFKRFLAPGGRVFVGVPNGESMHRRLGHSAGLLDDMMSLGQGDLELGHKRLYSKATLHAQLSDAGYDVCAMEGIFLKPFTTVQLQKLELSSAITDALCQLGVHYPELSCGLLAEARLR